MAPAVEIYRGRRWRRLALLVLLALLRGELLDDEPDDADTGEAANDGALVQFGPDLFPLVHASTRFLSCADD